MTAAEIKKIPANYVLVKVDDDFDTYQNRDTGDETGIHVAPYGVNQATHLSITGEVVMLPENFIYHGFTIGEMTKDNLRTANDQKEIARLRRESLSYAVPGEVPVGYRVAFEYTTRLNAFKEGRAIEDETGKYIFIPYDMLTMAFRPTTDFNNVQISDVYPLNGFVLIKPLEYATEKDSSGIVGTATPEQIFLPTDADAKYVHKDNLWYANVLAAGCRVVHYADFPNAGSDPAGIGTPGQKICYDGRHQKKLEQDHHRVIFKTKVIYRLHRKDIFGIFLDGKIN